MAIKRKLSECEGSQEYEVDDEVGLINALWQTLKDYDRGIVQRILNYLEDRNEDRCYEDEEEDY